MKKRKTYEISVIDKTYSNTISDETKFYTSDTALELGFELKETEYSFESAEIVLLNIDDRSLVTRPVAKVLDSFAYELEDDITAHYGEWRGQLRFEQAGEIYVSSPVKFRIENDLSNERPPQLSDVQSWVSLKRYADGLVDELKQAVLEVEGMDATFQANEQSRQTTFETNESERYRAFESNELTRQTQELERENAETNRQSVFDENEAIRTETFNTNEATRIANEEARELTEDERENAEAQRKTDHANRSAELDGKADKVIINNLIRNGDFSDGIISWTIENGTASFENGKVTITTNGKVGVQRISQKWINIPINHMSYFFYTLDEITNYSKRTMQMYSGSGSYSVNDDVIKLGLNSFVSVNNTSLGQLRYTIAYKQPANNPVVGSEYITISNPGFIDLTETFGAGNEPTKEEMDELIKVTGYIDNEYALNNKEMLIWTLALIRQNRNAIVALGGA